MVKLAFEMSKKTLPTQVTRTRAWVVGVLGIVIGFGAVVGGRTARELRERCCRRRCDRRISTLAQFTGAALVPPRSRSPSVCCCGQVTRVLGCVTGKGPAAAFTVTVVEAS